MFQDKSLTLLKNIVILKGVVLIVGVLVLFKMVATKFNSTKQNSCINHELQLNFDNIKNITTDNGKIFLHIIEKETDKIVFFDYCNANKINHITFKQ